jgi:RNA polymerase sigma factor (TIGR02999 family)
MSDALNQTVTRLLHSWTDGNPKAADELFPLIYEQLRRMAREYMRQERGGHTLQPTALVHEAYRRLAGGAQVPWQGRTHFYCLAARAMRRVLVDHARAREVRQRGDFQHRVPLAMAEEDFRPPQERGDVDLLALDSALERLAQTHPRPSRVVELRFFSGMEMQDIAGVLEVSEKTVQRDWQAAKVWLHRALGQMTG